MYTRGWLILIKTRLRGSGCQMGVLVFWCFLSDFNIYMFLSFRTIQVPTCHSKSSTSHRRMLSRYISPTNHEPRLPRDVSVEVIPYFPVSSLLCNLSLENDVTLMSSGYMSTWSCYWDETLVSSICPIITDWMSSNSRLHTIVIEPFLRNCRPSSVFWHLIDQLANI